MLRGSSTSWARIAPLAQFAHNAAVSTLTGSTPFSLFLGRYVNALSNDTAEWPNADFDVAARVRELRRLSDIIFPAVRSRIERARRRQHRALDSRRHIVSADRYTVGSRVMLRDPNRTRKLDPTYIGLMVLQLLVPFSYVTRTVLAYLDL
jgi:hypothetical protein